jgi:hypothetical protein
MAIVLVAVMALAQVISDGVESIEVGALTAPIPEETVALADEVGVDAVQLQGAVTTTRSTPRTYLEHEGLLKPPPRAVASAGPVRASTALWDRLAACESSGNWSAVSRSGVYRGGLQFDQPTWSDFGGLAYASSAHLASKAQQIAVAERLRAARGMQPWPVCGRRV